MKRYTALGIDPGLANTALGIVASDGSRYRLLAKRLIQTDSKDTLGIRLLQIYEATYELLNTKGLPPIDTATIERVFHAKNVTSSISTGKAIGAAATAIAQHDIPIVEITPQQVKKASGLGSSADKKELVRIASRIFRTPIDSHHEADAGLAAVAGILKLRSEATHNGKETVPTGKPTQEAM